MTTAPKDILLVGYGAVGALYALILKRSGQVRVTVVARSNYVNARDEGMTFKSQKYGEIAGWRPDRLCATVTEAANQAYSYVIVATKIVPEVETTPQLLAPLIEEPYLTKFPQPTFVLFQNGISIEKDLYQALKTRRPLEDPHIISASVYIASRLVSKNVAEHSYFDRVDIGMYRTTPNILTNSPKETNLLTSLGNILKAGGTEVNIVPEIHRVKFEKNIWNVTLGSATVLTRHSFQSMFRPPTITLENPDFDPATMPYAQIGDTIIPAASKLIAEHTIPFLYETILEIFAVGNALFPPVTADTESTGSNKESNITNTLFPEEKARDILKWMATMGSKATSAEVPSILVDVDSGRPTEVEVLIGEVVRAGKQLGVPIPRLETFYAMILVTQTELLRKIGIQK